MSTPVLSSPIEKLGDPTVIRAWRTRGVSNADDFARNLAVSQHVDTDAYIESLEHRLQHAIDAKLAGDTMGTDAQRRAYWQASGMCDRLAQLIADAVTAGL